MAEKGVKIVLSLDGKQYSAELQRAGVQMQQFGTQASASMERASGSAQALTGHLARMGHAAVGALGAQKLGAFADEWANLNARVALASQGLGNGQQAMAAVTRIAADARTSVATLGETYGTLARAGSELGISQQRVLAVTETIARSMALSGGSAESARAALVQFGQGLQAGTLRGEELNSVLEQAPRLAKALAEGLGQPVGALKAMAEQGEITAEAIFTALERSRGKIDAEFAQMPATLGQSFTVLRDSLMQTVGVFDQANGLSHGFAQGILAVARNMDVAMGAIAALGAGYLALNSNIAGTLAAKAELAAASRLAAAQAAAEGAANAEVALTSRAKLAAYMAELQAKVASAQADAAAQAAKVAELAATAEVIVAVRAETAAKLQASQASMVQAQAQLAAARAVGAQSMALALAREATEALTAAQARNAALVGELALLGQQQARVQASIAAATTAQTAATQAAAKATGTLAAAQGAAATAGGLAARALGLLTGPIGATITLLGLGATAWVAWKAAGTSSEKAVEKQVTESHEEVVKRIDEQIAKLRERNQLAGAPVPEAPNQTALDAGKLYTDAYERYNKIVSGQGEFANLPPAVHGALLKSAGEAMGRAYQRYTDLADAMVVDASAKTAKARATFMADYRDQTAKMADALAAYDKQFKDKVSAQQYQQDTDAIRAKFRKASTGNAAALKKEASAYQELMASIGAKVEASKTELAQGEALTDSQKLTIKLDADLATGKLKLSAAHEAAARAKIEELAAQERSRAVQEGEIKLAQELAAARQEELRGIEAYMAAQAAAAAKSLQSVQDRLAGLEEEERAAQLAAAQNISLAEAVERVAIARLREEQARFNDIEGGRYREIEKEIEAREKLLTVMGQKEAREALKKTADAAENELKRVTEQYEQGLTNAAMQGGKSLKEYVLGMLRTTAFRIVLDPIMKPLAGLLASVTGTAAGAAGGSGGGLLGTVLQGTQLYSGLTSGQGVLGSIGSFLGMGAAATGAGIAATTGAGLTLASTAGGLGLSAATGTGLSLASGATGLGLTASSAGAGAIGAGLGSGAAAAGGAAATTTGLAGSISSAIAAVPVWGWIAAGVLAIGSALSKKPTPHSGGAAYADPYMRTALQTSDATPVGFSSYTDKETLSKVTGVAQNTQAMLNAVLATAQSTSRVSVLTGFADDKSKDGAWGQLIIKKLDASIEDALVNWESTRTEKWAPRVFADGERGYKEYINAVASDSIKALQSVSGELPAWVARMVNAADAGAEDAGAVFEKLAADIAAYPETILARLGTSGQALAEQFAQGMGQGNPQAVGEAFAQTIVGGIEGALVGNLASQVTNLVTSGMVTPFVDAIMAGATASEALAAVSMQQTLDRVKAQATAFKELWGNEEFQAALGEMRGMLASTVTEAASAAQYTPRYTAAIEANTAATQAGTDANREAEEAARRIAEERKGLQNELDELTMTRAQLLAKERSAIDASNQSLWDQVQAARDAKAVADERKTIQDELNGLADTAAQALARQRDALHESNRALFDQVQALRLQQQLLAEVPTLIEKYTTDAQRQASGYARIAADLGAAGIGVSAEALMGATKAQIAQAVLAIHAMGSTSDETRLALVRAASGLSDLKDAATSAANTAADTALSSLQRSIEAEKSAIAEAANARIEALRKEAEAHKAAQETAAEDLATASRIADALGRAVRTLRGQVESTAVQDLAAARRFIEDAARAAAATGALPDEDALARAIESVTADQQQRYATYADWEAAQLDQANQLAALGALGESQMTVAERQLAATKGQVALLEEQIKATQDGATAATLALDEQLKAAQERLAVLRDSNAALKSIAESSAGFEAALARLAAAQSASAVGGGGGGGGGGSGAPSGTTGGSAVLNGPMGSQYDPRSDTFYGGSSGLPYSGKALGAAAVDMVNAGQARELYDIAVANGVTAAMLAQWTGTSATDLNAWAREQGLPAFAQGTNYVPRDMLALIHEGEEIVPKRYNPAAQGDAWTPARSITARIGGGGAESALQAVVVTLAGAVERLGNATGGVALAAEERSNLKRIREVLEGAALGRLALGVTTQ